MAKKQKPVGVMLIAIFNLIFGLPCLLGALCIPFAGDASLAMLEALPKAPGPQAQDPAKMVKDQQEFMRKEIPAQKAVTIALAVLQLGYSLLLLVSGIMLLSGKPLGRTLAIVAVALMALTTLANIAFGAMFVVPATSKWEQQQAKVQVQPMP
jgi:hypothetical protein